VAAELRVALSLPLVRCTNMVRWVIVEERVMLRFAE
jgi:hypothetical protein